MEVLSKVGIKFLELCLSDLIADIDAYSLQNFIIYSYIFKHSST